MRDQAYLDQLTPLQRAVFALKQARAKLDALEQARAEPIAVIGLACRFPGAGNQQEFWELLCDGRNFTREVPPDRFDVDAYYDPELAPGKMNTRWAGLLDAVDQFDPAFFGISADEAASMDPQQRLALEVAWEAIEDAGVTPEQISGSATGVFLGATHSDYFGLLKGAPRRGGTGVGLSIMANRISYLLDLHGPSFTVDSACSSSLLAAHLACQSLRSRECDLALAGGINVILRPEITIGFAQAGMMAPDGRCKTFDAAANGYVRGEGCGILVLKRISDARATGDRVLATIRGSATNQDGRSNGLTAPNGKAQQAVIRAALNNAGIEAWRIGYIEAHGTGTLLGDTVEVEALKAVFESTRSADKPCALGAVKTNIGHLEAAAGAAGLIKLVLALQNRTIPPIVNFRKLNPNLERAGFPFVIPQTARPWPREDESRCAGISSFSFGGTNVHMVLEEADDAEPEPSSKDAIRPLHVLTLSAKCEPALQELAGRYARYLPDPACAGVEHVCYSANVGRAKFPHRLAVVASSAAELREALVAFPEAGPGADGQHSIVPRGRQPRIAMLFGGQYERCAGAGASLYRSQPTFRDAIDRCDRLLSQPLGASIVAVLLGQRPDLIERPEYSRPALFALQYAMVELFRSWGVEPAAVMGLGVGEIAAACCASALKLEDALSLLTHQTRPVVLAAAATGVWEADAMPASLQPARIPIVCGADGRRYAAGSVAALTSVGQDRAEPAPGSLAALECEIFIELGLGQVCAPKSDALVLSGLKQGEDDWRTLLSAVSRLFLGGVNIDWAGFDKDYARRKVALPTYPFQRKRYWLGPDQIGGPAR